MGFAGGEFAVEGTNYPVSFGGGEFAFVGLDLDDGESIGILNSES